MMFAKNLCLIDISICGFKVQQFTHKYTYHKKVYMGRALLPNISQKVEKSENIH